MFFYEPINLATALIAAAPLRSDTPANSPPRGGGRRSPRNQAPVTNVNHIAIARLDSGAGIALGAGMSLFSLPASLTSLTIAVAGLSVAAFVIAGLRRRRIGAQHRRLSDAIDNMSQGLIMFDGQTRIVLVNRRYLEMYSLSPDVIKPGCTLNELIQHRKETGLFTGDVDAYCQKILDEVKSTMSKSTYVQASDGHIVLAKNIRLANGGWLSTHEDVTEQRHAEQERAASNEQDKRRKSVDANIASFRPLVETLLASVSDSAAAMRATAVALLSSSDHTTQHASSAVEAFHEASTNVETAAVAADELSRSIAEISRQLTQTSDIVALATDEARATDGEIAGLAAGAQKIDDVVTLIRDIAGQTNLLALNATIEAARAGDAGKGFAVVAAEVKSLAVQTAAATEEIASHILAVQDSTADAVEAIRQIAARMQEINQYTAAVAAAVEQQNSATGEISHNVAGAADSTGHVVVVLSEVTNAATETRSSAEVVRDVSQTVTAAVDKLRHEVEDFLAKVAV
jgi:methyl-accepting chemotaxis protein